ncbi:MAG: methyltransferase domain-containing protein [Verrucomicrobia bacterium]|nr:methyltransferase domain-containing protein [Verrucomicrobiota bacterium]
MTQPSNIAHAVSSWGAFFKAWIASPREVGAACPSSPGLARRMAAFAPVTASGLIVELGAGTGVVTRALLQSGVSPQRIVPVERSPEMAAVLKHRFPHLTVIQGDACQLAELLKPRLHEGSVAVDAVVSSLPLRSLPGSVVEAIMEQLRMLLGADGKYIQFTYDLRPNTPCPLKGFARIASKIAWWNIPPARVDLFEHRTPQV